MAKNSSDETDPTRFFRAAMRYASLLAVAAFFFVLSGAVTFAQLRRTENQISSEIRVEEPDQKITQLIERAKIATTDQQWDEALDLYASVIEQAGDQIVRLDAARFVTVREFCQRQIAAAPDTLRKLYRTRYDAHAQKLYDAGIEVHSRAKLQSVVDDFFLSSVGDDALFALGELSLEEGSPSIARQCWERLLPKTDAVLPSTHTSTLNYPDSNIGSV